MTSPPKRLIDDEAFQARTGIDLSAESTQVPTQIPASTQARVLEAVIANAPSATALSTAAAAALGWKAGLVGLIAGAFLGGGTVHLLGDPPADVVTKAPESNDGAMVEAPTSVVQAPQPEPEVAVAKASVAQEQKSKSAGGRQRNSRAEKRGDARASKPSSLAAELRDFQRAEIALSDRRYKAAAKEYRRYLRSYRNGSLVTESELGLLKALTGAGDFAAAYPLVKRLLVQKKMAGQRASLLRFKASVETGLRRCDDAEKSLQAARIAGAPNLGLKDIAAARAACEKARQ